MERYPSPPWRLRGRIYVSLWRTGGKRLAATVLAEYLPGGDLSYHELAYVRLVWRGGPALTVPLIWVDGEEALDGGRELWDIPKEWASFEEPGRVAAIAALRFRRTFRLPGRWPFSMRIVQPRATTRLRVRGRLELGRGDWRFVEGGPLGFLVGHRPLLSFSVPDATIVFGDEPKV